MDQLKAGIHGDIQAVVRSAEDQFARMGMMGGAGSTKVLCLSEQNCGCHSVHSSYLLSSILPADSWKKSR